MPRHFWYHSDMVKLNAHFDGKVIVPDEPLALKPNQKLRISIEAIEAASPAKRVNLSKIRGMGLEGQDNPNPQFTDDDSLWEGSIGSTLGNDPRKKQSH